MKKFSPIKFYFDGDDLETLYNTNFRPKCVNEGCGRLAQHVHKNRHGEIRYRATCYDCHLAGMGLMNYHAGVTPRKKGYCENNGQYGFVCLNKKLGIKGYETDLHHKDHNHRNNDPRNIDELCKECHTTHHAKEGKGVLWEH